MKGKLFLIFFLALHAALAQHAGAAPPSREESELMARLTSKELMDYFGLQYLLNPTEKLEYLSLPTSRERSQWLDRFWIECDPTPATEANEARKEHAHRVELARELFSMNKAPGWDDRGEILIRFGPPSSRTPILGEVTTTGLALPRELWYYAALNMSVLFHDIDLKGRYAYNVAQRTPRVPGPTEIYASNSSTMRGRGPFSPPNMDYTADELNRLMEAQLQPYRIWELEGMRASRADENFYLYEEKYAAIYSCDTEWMLLPLYFDVVSFRGGESSVRADFSFEVPVENLTLVRGKGKSRAEVDLAVLVRDENGKPVAHRKDCIEFEITGDTIVSPRLLPGQIALALKPGRYRVGIEARDRNAKRRAAYRTDVEIIPFAGAPALSEIQFARDILETDGNRPFVKGNLQVVPHPTHAYRIPEPVAFYFEIYGFDTDRDGKAYYRVEYRIVPLEKRRWGPMLKEVPTTISSSFETSAYGATQPQRLSIATDELWEGTFRLEVTVTDRRTSQTAARSAEFSILK